MVSPVSSSERAEIVQLRDVLTESQKKILEQQMLLVQLTATPLPYGVVVRVGKNIASLDAYEPSKRVKFVSGRFAGRFGKILRPIDSDGEIYVEVAEPNTRIWVQVAERLGRKPLLDPQVELLDVPRGFAVVAVDGRLVEMVLPSGMEIFPGTTVKIAANTMQIVGVSETVFHGEVAIARRKLTDDKLEITVDGSNRVVFAGNVKTVKAGDRIILDPSSIVAIQNLGQENRYSFTMSTNVTWDDIGGLREAKEQLIEAIEFPRRYSSFYRAYGKRPIKGALLYGPPRCGKTMLGKAVATAFARLNGRTASEGFLYVKGPELLNMYVGNTEAAIRQLFSQARQFKLENGYPAVIFFDEADSLLRKRGTGVSSDMEATIVPMFLSEMDGLDDSGALVLLATNRPDVLDPAIVGDKRIDRKIFVGRPDREVAREILRIYLGRTLIAGSTRVSELVDVAITELFSDRKVIEKVTIGPVNLSLHLRHILNGAMVEAVVDHASSIALKRDIGRGQANGIARQDIIDAVNQICKENKENKDLNHSDEVLELARQEMASRPPYPTAVPVSNNGGGLNA